MLFICVDGKSKQCTKNMAYARGITLLLTMGASELAVKKISGHSANSKSFQRYVNLAQEYLDTEINLAHEKLVNKNALTS